MAKTDHIICFDGRHGKNAYAMKCQHCGTLQRVALPISIDCYNGMSKAFERSHRDCKPTQAPVPTEQDNP